MLNKFSAAIIGVASFITLSTAAQAVTFTTLGSGSTGLIGSTGASGVFEDSPGAGLGVDGAGKLTFTFLGVEGGFNNQFFSNLNLLFTNHTTLLGATGTQLVSGPGLLSFAFNSNSDPLTLLANGSGTNSDAAEMIAFQLVNAHEANLFFDDNYGDKNFTDMSINVKLASVSSVPLPAALPLLAAGLAGIGVLGRKRRKAKV